jgi:2-polyprenyl-3-methyl-5-hydroxy-6-metoxy-1,4-benzoquinol methylase
MAGGVLKGLFKPRKGAPRTAERERILEAARWAYRLILLREPESEAAVEQLAAAGSPREMRDVLLRSAELRGQSGFPVQTAMTGLEPPQPVQLDVTDAERERLFSMVHSVWRQLGKDKPHWSVLSSNEFLPENMGTRSEAFYETGEWHVQLVMRTLERNGLAVPAEGTCLDYGCGLGRLSFALARRFRLVAGADVSEVHLDIARREAEHRGIGNVTWHHVADVRSVKALPDADLLVSLIVLQHNPPPVMRELFARMLGRLRPGGVAVIQMPTYLPGGYRFRVADYLATGGRDMEMHPLPQREAFRVVREAGVEMVEVLEDGSSALGYGGRSNTFVVRRPGP